MISDKELFEKIDDVSGQFVGQLDDLYKVVGMIVMGRLFGWRVVRLVSTPLLWRSATRLFGDPKELMPERGKYAYKSIGLRVVDEMGDYWNVIKGVNPVPAEKKKEVM